MVKLISPLAPNVPITDKNGNPTPYFQRVLDEISSARVSASLIDALGGDPGADRVVIWDETPDDDLRFATASEVLDMIGNTHGAILYRDTDADGWKILAPGTAGQLLQTNGAGVDPSWITPAAGGGSFSYIGRTAVTTLSNVDIALSDTYDSFYIEFYLVPNTDGVNFSAAITDDNFATVESGATDYRYTQLRSAASATGVTSSSGASSIAMIAGVGNSTNEFISGRIDVINAKETSATTIIADFNYVSTAASYSQCRLMSDYVGTQSINGLRVSVSSGNVTGFYKIWGRDNA